MMSDLSNNNIVHIKKEDVEYVQFKRLLEYSDVLQHAYTLRKKDINFIGKKENLENRKRSIKAICNSLDLKEENIISINQTHSANVEIVNDVNQKFDNVDGLITNKSNFVFQLSFADCTPILLFDPVNKVIGNIHSGWKGTVQRIGEKAIKIMNKEFNCEYRNIIACFGPNIGFCHFEVDEDVKNIFEENFKDVDVERAIRKGEVKEEKQKYFINTNLINRMVLEKLGVSSENIIESNICTVCEKESFHSYRADKDLSGRNTCVMSLR